MGSKLGASCIRCHGGSYGGCEWPWGVIGVSLGVRVGESALEGNGGKGGDLLGQRCDHVHGVFA